MKNKKRLGSIPKGLEWIEEKQQQSIVSSNEDDQDYTLNEYHPPLPQQSHQKIEPEQRSASAKGLPIGWTRATLIVRESHLKKLKAVSYWDRVTIKHLVDQALDCFLADKRVRSLNVKKI